MFFYFGMFLKRCFLNFLLQSILFYFSFMYVDLNAISNHAFCLKHKLFILWINKMHCFSIRLKKRKKNLINDYNKYCNAPFVFTEKYFFTDKYIIYIHTKMLTEKQYLTKFPRFSRLSFSMYLLDM